MKIEYLKLLNFRSYSSIFINFSDNLNIIYGLNGSGKTNIVEAIYALSLTKSFRTNVDNLMIMNNKTVSKIEAQISSLNKSNNYQLILQNHEKNVKINNIKINKLSDYVSSMFMILFNPDDLRIIKDAPALRRNLLNIELSQLDRNYILYLNGYNKILKQRNIYLKEMNINGYLSRDYLNVLTKQLIFYGRKIYDARLNFIDNIKREISNIYNKISGSGNLEIFYDSDFNKSDDELLNIYNKYLKKDMLNGKTSIGIHHDDLKFILNDFVLKECGSEGQQKNALISFKLSEINIVKKIKGYYPILIFDDLSSELDNEKINNILNLLDNKVQTFITTTNLNNFSSSFLEKAKLFYVAEGKLEEKKYE